MAASVADQAGLVELVGGRGDAHSRRAARKLRYKDADPATASLQVTLILTDTEVTQAKALSNESS